MTRALVLVVTVFLATLFPAQATTYRYEGIRYATPTSPFTTDMRVAGSFTTAAPLPPDMPLTAIGPLGADLVLDWSFSDGLTTYTPANSAVFGEVPFFSFSVATDDQGQVVNAIIGLVSPLPPHVLNQPVNAFLISTAAPHTLADHQLPCLSLGSNDSCADSGIDQVDEDTGGVWSIAAAAPAPIASATVPSLDAKGILGLVLTALALAALRLRSLG